MKRWPIAVGIVVLSIMAGAIAIWPELKAVWVLKWREEMTDSMADKSKKNLETEVVRVQIAEHKFDIPMRFFYWEAYIKHGYWPSIKKERANVGALSLSMLLPELRPYYLEDEARWKTLGWGDKLEVTVTKPVPGSEGWFQFVRDQYLTGKEPGNVVRKPDEYGLMYFDQEWTNAYFPVDPSIELKISCDSRDEVPSASCKVKSNYKQGLVLEYSYSLNHFPRWREIDQSLKATFDRFNEAAQS